jgi:hypothetical protein
LLPKAPQPGYHPCYYQLRIAGKSARPYQSAGETPIRRRHLKETMPKRLPIFNVGN